MPITGIVSFELKPNDEIELAFGHGTTNVVTRQGLSDMYQLKLIFVVTIEPTGGEGGVGGFEWRTEYRAAEEFYVGLVQDLQRLHDPNLLTLWACLVPDSLVPEEISNYVDDGFITNDPETAVPYVKKINETVTEPPHVVMVGNPIDGIELFGPFGTGAEATEYAEQQRFQSDWWVAPITRPAES